MAVALPGDLLAFIDACAGNVQIDLVSGSTVSHQGPWVQQVGPQGRAESRGPFQSQQDLFIY